VTKAKATKDRRRHFENSSAAQVALQRRLILQTDKSYYSFGKKSMDYSVYTVCYSHPQGREEDKGVRMRLLI
jgi:hypothetical protein